MEESNMKKNLKKITMEFVSNPNLEPDRYVASLIANGYNVIDSKVFGDYQGTWIAIIKDKNQYKIITDYYGSCPSCDNFYHNEMANCKSSWYEDFEFIKEFGKQYIDTEYTMEEFQNKLDDNWYFDSEKEEMQKFIDKYKGGK
jgi:hypothetical protein